MEKICYLESFRNSKFKNIEHSQISNELEEKFKDKYTSFSVDAANWMLPRQLIPFLNIVKNYKDKKVLDIGCGSRESFYAGICYEPWFCRALLELGAKPVGVDLNSNSGEEFENHQVNFLEDSLLNLFQENHFDIANAGGIFNLPDVDSDRAKKILYPQLKKILKPEGIFIYQDI